MTIDLNATTPLVPVSEWKWFLWAVRYMNREGGNTIEVRLVVETETHIEIEIGHQWTPRNCYWIEWYCIQEEAAPRRRRSNLEYDEGGWVCAERRYGDRRI